MKKTINYWLALALLLPALTACHDDETMPDADTTGKPTVVRASIGNEPGTRAQVQYGTQEANAGEIFMWNKDDEFTACRIPSSGPVAKSTFTISSDYDEKNPSRQADFSSTDFSASAGETIFAFYNVDAILQTLTSSDGKKGMIISVYPAAVVSQQQYNKPGNSDLVHLKNKIFMYAIGQAVGNNTVSPLSFHHLTALFRFTIRNQQTTAAKISKVRISFTDQQIFCTKKNVTVWEDGGTSHFVEEEDKTDTRELKLSDYLLYPASIAANASYDCYLPVLPVADTGNTASSPIITLLGENDTEIGSVTIAGFTNVDIRAGMRYWFDLTITSNGTVVQTSSLGN